MVCVHFPHNKILPGFWSGVSVLTTLTRVTITLGCLVSWLPLLCCERSSPAPGNGGDEFEDQNSNGNWTQLAQLQLQPQASFLHQIPLQHPRPTQEHLYSFEQIDKLRGKYKLADFLWTGSGDGPLPSEPDDGGLAWEENGAYVSGGTGTVVLVTKTIILFKTVITTVFPAELTPTIVLATPTISVISSDSFSPFSPAPDITPHISSSTEHISVEPTPTVINPTSTLQIIEILPTPTASPPSDEKTTTSPHEEMPTPAHDQQTDESTYTNPIYWVNTIIKANGSQVHGEFQSEMQRNLAQVYASAFKRHLLSSLGVLNGTQTQSTGRLATTHLRRRKRNSRWKDFNRDELDFQWLLLRDTGMTVSQIKSLASTVMNVSVAIVNITSDQKQPHVSMDYVVTVEGKPVAASAAVQDMHLITKREMEKQIGYEVIKKAEPLISLPIKEQEPTEGAGTSPWLIVAITTICLLVVLSIVLVYMVWKWKHNRLSDTSIRARPQSGIEGGVINPAFLGPPSPIERSGLRREKPASSFLTKTEMERRQIRKEGDSRSSKFARVSEEQERQTRLSSELKKRLDKPHRSSPSSMETPISESPTRDFDKENADAEEKLRRDLRRKRGKKEAAPDGTPVEKKEPGKSGDLSEKRKRRKTLAVTSQDTNAEDAEKFGPLPEPLDGGRPSSAARDKITYGHLDVSEDPLARSMSDEARKLLHQSKARSASESSLNASSASEAADRGSRLSRRRRPQTIDEISDKWSQDKSEGVTNEEKDRESAAILSGTQEGQEPRPTTSASALTKDAQVQTPTRIHKKGPSVKTKSKPSPTKARRRSPTKFSTESLLSTESEEIEIKELDTSTEANPLRKMRKRFHQFLDDAFNVMGKRELELNEEGRARSAKLSVSHEVETKDEFRPWTSQLIREESLEQIRPKSAASSTIIAPPKRAWTAGTQRRRCQSATSSKLVSPQMPTQEEDEFPEEFEKCDLTSTTVQPSSAGIHQSNILSFSTPVFPGYPIYPDIPLPNTQPGSSQAIQPTPPSSRHQTDTAVPLIEAIKMEIKRFDTEKNEERRKKT